MPKALILVADGSEEIEFVTPYDVLTRAGFDVTSAGVSLKNENYAHMTRDIRIVPDYPILSSVPDPTDFDILILPGGGPGAKTFSTTDSVLELVHNFRKNYKWVAAICAGTTALVASDEKYSTGKTRVTSHPSVRGEVEGKGWEYSEERVVIDRKVVTSRAGSEKRDEVAGPMVVAETL